MTPAVTMPEFPAPTQQQTEGPTGKVQTQTHSPAAGQNSGHAADTPSGRVWPCGPGSQRSSTVFDPGAIISDAVFYDVRAMNQAEVRRFIGDRGAACTGAECLKNLRITSPDQPADRYCTAYRGGRNEDAAAVLTKLSVTCGINPQVMLVTLQKESALLTRRDATASSYDAAFGWHCPDTGPGGSANCAPAYSGFFNQAAGMAKQWARYRLDPQNYSYRAGHSARILWNVAESGCGASQVFIRNTATASLYDYTPYQPNPAALAGYPGTGDRCSAYGNRNFFFLFQEYFGASGTTPPEAVAHSLLDGVKITVPTNPYVAPAARGAVITAPTAAIAKGLSAGFAAIGLPYVYGGGTSGGNADQGCARAGGMLNSCQGTVGFDCSGLTGYVLKQAGVTIPDNSAAQRSAGTPVTWSHALPGDIIGYQGHVAIYLGIIRGVPYLLEAPDVGLTVQIRAVYYTNEGASVDQTMYRYWH